MMKNLKTTRPVSQAQQEIWELKQRLYEEKLTEKNLLEEICVKKKASKRNVHEEKFF